MLPNSSLCSTWRVAPYSMMPLRLLSRALYHQVVIGLDLRIHLGDEGLVFGGAVDFPDGPGGEGRLGVPLVPVAAVATSVRQLVVEDGVDHHAGILRTHRVIRLNLVVIHGAHVVLGYLGVEVGHGVGVLPAVPGPDAVEPAGRVGGGDAVVEDGASRRAPVAVEGLHRLDRDAPLRFRDALVGEAALEVILPATDGGIEGVGRVGQQRLAALLEAARLISSCGHSSAGCRYPADPWRPG